MGIAALSVFCIALLAHIWITLKGKMGREGLFSLRTRNEVEYKSIIPNKKIRCRYIVNCAGLFSDKIARMVGDNSFKIKPRIGDYLLLHKDQGHLAKCTLFPCPDVKVGTKGVL